MPIERRSLYASAAALAAASLLLETGHAQSPPAPQTGSLTDKILALTPQLENRVAQGMKAFDVPGVAVGIVAADRLIYAKGFGSRGKQPGGAVTPQTVFQIGSTTKAFLAALLAIAVDRGKLAWDDRLSDRYPDFALSEPYATREFRVYDILSQRSGLPPYANDFMFGLGFGPEAAMHSLRYVPPASSFRAVFTYTNITHLFGGKVAAQALGAPDWPAAATREILEPLGMHSTTFTAAGIESASDHAAGNGWTPQGSFEIPYTADFYGVGPAGDINSNIVDCAAWLRLMLANGRFEGHQLVSVGNLAVTRMARVGLTDEIAYAMGWILFETPNGRVIFHNGGTNWCGAHIGFLPDKNFGVIVFSNVTNKGLPDAIALDFYDLALGNPPKDRIDEALKKAVAGAEKDRQIYTPPPSPATPPPDDDILARYQTEGFGSATLTRVGDDLVMTFTETGGRAFLRHFDGATFTLRADDPATAAALKGSPYSLPDGFASFEPGLDGRPNRLRLLVGAQSMDWIKLA